MNFAEGSPVKMGTLFVFVWSVAALTARNSFSEDAQTAVSMQREIGTLAARAEGLPIRLGVKLMRRSAKSEAPRDGDESALDLHRTVGRAKSAILTNYFTAQLAANSSALAQTSAPLMLPIFLKFHKVGGTTVASCLRSREESGDLAQRYYWCCDPLWEQVDK